MNLADVAQLTSTVATIVTTLIAVFTFLSDASTAKKNKKPPPSHTAKYIAIVGCLAFLSVGAAAFSYFDRNKKLDFGPNDVTYWGIPQANVYQMSLNTNGLGHYKSDHKLMLVVRVSFSDVDSLTDKNVEKSGLYSITGEPMALAAVGTGKLKGPAGKQIPLEFHALLVPSKIRSDQITSISDVLRFDGRILASRSMLINL